MEEPSIVILHPRDNVATTLTALKAGQVLVVPVAERNTAIALTADVPFGHKFALMPIAPGTEVIKYGEVIGTATTAIAAGDYVHVHNVVSGRGRGDLAGGKP